MAVSAGIFPPPKAQGQTTSSLQTSPSQVFYYNNSKQTQTISLSLPGRKATRGSDTGETQGLHMHGASTRQSLCGIYLMHERLAQSLAHNLSTTSPQPGAVHSWRVLALSPVSMEGGGFQPPSSSRSQRLSDSCNCSRGIGFFYSFIPEFICSSFPKPCHSGLTRMSDAVH